MPPGVPPGPSGESSGPEGIEEHELASDLYVTLRVGMHDHTQPTIEVVVLFKAQVVELLEREGFVAGEEGISIALELYDEFSPSLDLL